MDHLQNAVETLGEGLSSGLHGVGLGSLGEQLKGHLDTYNKDSNGLIMIVVGLIVIYFVMKTLMPMIQSGIVIVIIGLVAWIAFQKWGGGSGGGGGSSV